jgi:hypothetical protein
MNPEYRPIKFIDQLEGNKHIVLLYDNEDYADLIIARYFSKGLEKGESCVFFTDEDPKKIRRMLTSQGLDVERYEKANTLRIFQMPKPDSSNQQIDVLTILRGIRSASTTGMKRPFRFAGRTIPDIESRNGIMQGMVVERTGQEHFDEFDNAQMCFYDIRKIEPTKKDEWIKQLLENHHKVIFASDPDRAVAFDTSIAEGVED